MIELAVPYISQRTVVGDLNKDGKADAYQTCLTTSATMIVNFYYPGSLDVNRANSDIVTLANQSKRSRYHHSVVTDYLKSKKVTSVFSVNATLAQITAHLAKKHPLIWCNKLTHSGHCVVISGDNGKQLRINDPFGEVFVKGNATSYQDIRKPYWLSYASFQKFGMFAPDSHWVHFCSSGGS
jgi:Peptidase_C39 like family